MRININGGAFNARDSNGIFGYMYSICKMTKCEDCNFGSGGWVPFDGDNIMIRCETALHKEYMKRRNESGSGNQ